MTSVLEREIHEQPLAMQRLLDYETEQVSRLAAAMRGQFDYAIIAARGSSDNAARYAQYLWGAHNRLPVALATPSLFTLYGRPPRLDGALVVGISQSGQSPDIVAVVAEGQRQGRPTLAITNDPGSPLAAAAGHTLLLHTGPEEAVAATKTYTASLAALALFSCQLAGDEERLAQLQRMPAVLDEVLSTVRGVLPRVERYRYMEQCAIIGRGYNYATAFEIALKIKELARLVAEPYSSADFRHGPIAMVCPGFPVLAVALGGAVAGDIHGLVDTLYGLEAELLLISDDPALLAHAQLPMPLPAGLPEWLTPLAAVLPGQLFSLALAQARGLDPDRPAGLTKVTETL